MGQSGLFGASVDLAMTGFDRFETFGRLSAENDRFKIFLASSKRVALGKSERRKYVADKSARARKERVIAESGPKESEREASARFSILFSRTRRALFLPWSP